MGLWGEGGNVNPGASGAPAGPPATKKEKKSRQTRLAANEVWVRFMAYKVKSDGLWDPWFVFDSTLVSWLEFVSSARRIAEGNGPNGLSPNMEEETEYVHR